uniref:Large ribosomal subunit protein eL30 n=1 Tax=Fervidicoccus fontis TaxID=683846 RepID=A0A7J3ZKL3_9CREN
MSSGLERELRTAYITGKVVLGSKSTIKLLKLGKVKLVVVAANADPMIRSDIEYYAQFSSTPILTFNGTSLELGALLGKPFPIQALAVLDPGESHVMELVEEAKAGG